MLVVLESPYADSNGFSVESNVRYARRCMRDCVERGESPLASHLLYTQLDILDDTVAHERERGIRMGYNWGMFADKVVVYKDRGISFGMSKAIEYYDKLGIEIEYRYLPLHLLNIRKED